MPIVTQCPHCGKKFRAPDKLAGKSVKCPGCQGVVRVLEAESSAAPSSQPTPQQASAASWYILTENRQQMGPVSKEQLDNLATQGRLSFCQIRRGDWKAWKWADDVYPELPASERKDLSADAAPKSDEQDSARLVICPDCGNTVSRRATQCPHCGCPAAVLLNLTDAAGDVPVAARPPSPPPVVDGVPTDDLSDVAAPRRSRSRRLYVIAGGVVLSLAIVGVVWWAIHAAKRPAPEVVAEKPVAPAPPPKPEPLSEELLSADDKSKCIDEAARKMAEYIDELQRQHHLPLAMLSQTADSVQMLKALADGNLDAIPDSTSAIPGGQAVEPYKSQAKELSAKCRDWVRKNLKRDPCTAGDVWETARQWAQAKREEILKPLGGLSVEGLLPELPAGP